MPSLYILKIHFNIILSSMPRSLKWFISLSFPRQNPLNYRFKMNQIIFGK